MSRRFLDHRESRRGYAMPRRLTDTESVPLPSLEDRAGPGEDVACVWGRGPFWLKPNGARATSVAPPRPPETHGVGRSAPGVATCHHRCYRQLPGLHVGAQPGGARAQREPSPLGTREPSGGDLRTKSTVSGQGVVDVGQSPLLAPAWQARTVSRAAQLRDCAVQRRPADLRGQSTIWP